jgi:hypothetical protein
VASSEVMELLIGIQYSSPWALIARSLGLWAWGTPWGEEVILCVYGALHVWNQSGNWPSESQHEGDNTRLQGRVGLGGRRMGDRISSQYVGVGQALGSHSRVQCCPPSLLAAGASARTCN